MSNAPARAQKAPSRTTTSPSIAGRILELKVSGNLMTLDAGLFCLFQQPGVAAPPPDGSGLPGVRISIPPQMHAPGGGDKSQGEVTIQGLHADGWLGPQDGAALVRVTGAPAQILITVYQSPNHPVETAPRLQVVPLSGPGAEGAGPAMQPAMQNTLAAVGAPPTAAMPGTDIVAHVQRTGDVSVKFGEWLGKQGSGNWIEGFGISPPEGVAAADLEYQAVLGRGWLSPWITDSKFCGSRGMALPLLGFNLRLRGKAAELFDCDYRASFVDGTQIGPIAAGKSCEAPSLSPLEAFQIILRPRGTATAARMTAKRPAAKAPGKSPAKPVAKAVAKVKAKPMTKAAPKAAAKRAPPARARSR